MILLTTVDLFLVFLLELFLIVAVGVFPDYFHSQCGSMLASGAMMDISARDIPPSDLAEAASPGGMVFFHF